MLLIAAGALARALMIRASTAPRRPASTPASSSPQPSASPEPFVDRHGRTLQEVKSPPRGMGCSDHVP
jgi:hypothetical protein